MLEQSEIRVGDLIQYRYSWGPRGFEYSSITTRAILEILEHGTAFIVEGNFRVEGVSVITHIPMHQENHQPNGDQPEDEDDE